MAHHAQGVSRASEARPIQMRKVRIKPAAKVKPVKLIPTQHDLTRCKQHAGCARLAALTPLQFTELCESWSQVDEKVRKQRAAGLVGPGNYKLKIDTPMPTRVCANQFRKVTGLSKQQLRTIRKKVKMGQGVTEELRGGVRKADPALRKSFFEYVNALEREPSHYVSVKDTHTVLHSACTQKEIIVGWYRTKWPLVAAQQDLIMSRRASLVKAVEAGEGLHLLLKREDRSPLPTGTVFINPPVGPTTLNKWLRQMDISRGQHAADMCDKCTRLDLEMASESDPDKFEKLLGDKLEHLCRAHVARLLCKTLMQEGQQAFIDNKIDVILSDLGSHIGIPHGLHASAYYLPQSHVKIWWLTSYAKFLRRAKRLHVAGLPDWAGYERDLHGVRKVCPRAEPCLAKR